MMYGGDGQHSEHAYEIGEKRNYQGRGEAHGQLRTMLRWETCKVIRLTSFDSLECR